MPGPIPKRDAERRRRNKSEVETITVDLSETLAQEVEIPAPPMKFHDKDGELLDEPQPVWHPIAENAYRSLAQSGQSIFMEPSDWATAFVLCETISRELKPKPLIITDAEGNQELRMVEQPLNGAVVNAFLKGWASLMATEGDRRRLKIELDRQKIRDAAGAAGSNVIPISAERENRFKDAR